RVVANGGQALSPDDMYSQLRLTAEGMWSKRLSDWLEDKPLAIAVCRSLIAADATGIWIEPETALRISRDIRSDAVIRSALRSVRHGLRKRTEDSATHLPPAHWHAILSREGDEVVLESLAL